MLEKVFYMSVLVSDQDKALDFYTNVLGMEKRVENPTPDGPRFLTVGVEVLKALELNRRPQVSSDSIMGGAVRRAAHVLAKTAPVPPPAHHDDLIRLAVRAPNLQALKPTKPIDQTKAAAERRNQVIGAFRRDT